MNLNRALRHAIGADQRSISFQDLWDKALDITTVGNRHAGVPVTVDTATQLTAVYAAWELISEAVSTLPVELLTADGVPQTLARPAWLDYPAPFETWTELAGQSMVSLLADGNGFCWVRWGDGGRIDEITVLDPTVCTRKRDGTVHVRNRDTGQTTAMPLLTSSAPHRAPVEILHIRGMTRPGMLHGMSPIRECAEAIGTGIAAQRYGASFYANDGTPGGIIEHPGRLSEIGQTATREAWQDLFSGPNKAKKLAVLQEGAKYTQLQIAPEEAQFLQTRQFTVAEIARLYGAPPHKLGDMTNTTGWGTGLVEQNTAFVQSTLRKWIVRLEGGFTQVAQCEAGDRQAADTSVRFNINEEALLRGATKDRWDMHRKNVGAGLVTADEARLQEGLPALPDGVGAVPWVPLAQSQPGETEGDGQSSNETSTGETK